MLFHFGEEEAVDGVGAPRGVFRVGDGGLGDGLEAPPLAAEGEDVGPRGGGGGRGDGWKFAGIRRAGFYPRGEISDDAVVELRAILRHFQIGIGVGERAEEEALLGSAGNDGGTGVAALAQGVAMIEAQAALLFRAGVAFVAFGDEHGADAFLEELERRGGVRGGGEGGRDGTEAQGQAQAGSAGAVEDGREAGGAGAGELHKLDRVRRGNCGLVRGSQARVAGADSRRVGLRPVPRFERRDAARTRRRGRLRYSGRGATERGIHAASARSAPGRCGRAATYERGSGVNAAAMVVSSALPHRRRTAFRPLQCPNRH